MESVFFCGILGIENIFFYWGGLVILPIFQQRKPWQENANQEVSQDTISSFRTHSLPICFEMQTKQLRDEERVS